MASLVQGAVIDATDETADEAMGPDGSPAPSIEMGRAIRFTENLGQWGDGPRFIAQGDGLAAAFGDDGVMYTLEGAVRWQSVKVSFAAAAPVAPRGVDDMGFPSNYFLGPDPSRWATGARSYRELLYEDVWPGIDLRYRSSGGALKYDVLVGADADASAVRFDVEGHEALEARGDRLDIRLPGGRALHDMGLAAWYEGGEAVAAAFQVRGDGYGFSVEREPGRNLVIDPLILPMSTLLGGGYNDMGMDMEQDAEGDVYVGGTTVSMDYPVTAGAYSQDYSSDDVVVTKLDRDCSEVLWSTFIGGSAEDLLTGIELDDGGDVLVLGETRSADFPVTDGAFQGAIGNRYSKDVYALRLGSDGSALRYSTFIGGYYDEAAGDIGVHDGRAYIAMMTQSSDFPIDGITVSVFGGVPLIMVLSPDGARAEHCMWWECSRPSWPKALHLDGDGNATIVGMTAAYDFPTTPGAYLVNGTGGLRGFVIRCDPDANVTVLSTYFGYTYAYPTELDVDAEGYIYLAGSTMKITGAEAMEITEGAWCSTVKGRNDAFISKMDPEGTRLVYSTLVGGNDQVWTGDLEVTDDGKAVLVGWMTDGAGYWVSPDCIDPVAEGTLEGFVFALNENGTAPVHSTFLGGPLYDQVASVEITGDDTMLLSGTTDSHDFPTTDGAFQVDLAGNTDIFVSELACLYPPGAPRNLTAAGMEGNVTLAWEPPQDDGGHAVTDYVVYRGADTGGLAEHALLGDVTTYVDEGVEYGVRYYYSVRAFNGRGLSPASRVASAVPLTAPDPPWHFTGRIEGSGIELSWEAPNFTGGLPVTDYRLYRGTPPAPVELLATVGSCFLGYWDYEVSDRATYTYELSSVTPYGESRARAHLALRNTGPPTAPLGLDHTYGDLFIELRWEEVEDDHGLPVKLYNVYRRGPGEEASRVGSVTAPERRYVDADVEVGPVYAYSVAAQNSKGEGERCPEHEARAMVRPWPPMGVCATAEEHAVRVTWSPPGSDGASALLEYRVYCGVGPDDLVRVGGVRVPGAGATAALLFLHDVPYDGVVRYYRVTAVNAEGESDPSPTTATRMYAVPDPPRSPTIEWGDGRLAIAWLPPRADGGTPVRSYTLHRRAAGEGGLTELVTLPATSLRYVDDTVRNGAEYTYAVTAGNLAGESRPSFEVSAVPAGPPPPPVRVEATGSNGSVRLTWEAPGQSGGLPLEGFRVFGVLEGLRLEPLEELGPSATEYVATGLTNGRVYLYAVRAFTGAGVSNLSDIVEGRPVGPPTAPLGLAAFWLDDHVFVTWSSPIDTCGAPVQGYRLHRADWEAGNWTVVTGLVLLFEDRAVERNATYSYSLCAYNSEGDGPVATVDFTVPAESPPPDEDALPRAWYWAAGAIAAAAVAAVAYLRLGRRCQGPPEALAGDAGEVGP